MHGRSKFVGQVHIDLWHRVIVGVYETFVKAYRTSYPSQSDVNSSEAFAMMYRALGVANTHVRPGTNGPAREDERADQHYGAFVT